ncbi:MAG: SprB repeat-containing protein, partial [Flavobacteriales bacterium]|nr:SprB repeat-containing protein [Flavobacteriales bacterium]
MIKRFTFLLIVLFSIGVNAQIILTQDTTICGTQNLTLQAFSGGSNGSSLFLTDDTHSPIVSIGFPFTFYGNTYTDLLISTNGYVTFDLANAGAFSPWTNNTAIPNPSQMPENAIMAAWHDIDPSVGGVIYEGVNGVAPNRVYVVTWCAVPMFSCNSSLATHQIKLYEGSNKIETFLQDKPLCLTWAGGTAIHGTVDATSANFDIVTDPTLLLPRNWPLPWTATNEGWEFIPNGPTGYTINSVPYQQIVAGTINWFDNNWNQIGTGNSLTVSPSVTTTYYASINRCDSGGTVSDSITITLASAISSQLTSNDATCAGNDATLSVTPDLNTTTPPWNISLMDANGNVLQTQNNVWNSYTFTNLFPGTYSVNIVEPTTGCSGLNSIIVKQVHIDLQLNAFSDNVSCFNGNDGYISVYADSGYPPYQYFINGVLNSNPPPYDTAFFNNLTAGTYVLSVLDTVNCMMRDTVIITDPDYPLQALAASKTTTCYGQADGIAVVRGAGGTPPYTYSWFNSAQIPFSNNDTVTGLFAGTYFAEVTDANGCDTFATINVIQPQTPLTASIQIMDVKCKGDSTGYIVATASGSYAPYSYVWLSASDTLREATLPVNITRDSLNNLPTGSYELHIYDAWGCFESYSNVVSEPTNPLASTLNKINDVDCYGDSTGQVQVVASGGIPNYTYLWDNNETSLVATNLTAGLHSVWITDDWGCVIEDTITINENALIEDSITIIQNVSCYGGSDGAVVISSYGGVGSHSYDWSNGHQGISQPDTNSGLLFGSYYVIVEDQLGCRVVDSIFISEPDVLETEASLIAH